jgi:hypothetical protein
MGPGLGDTVAPPGIKIRETLVGFPSVHLLKSSITSNENEITSGRIRDFSR